MTLPRLPPGPHPRPQGRPGDPPPSPVPLPHRHRLPPLGGPTTPPGGRLAADRLEHGVYEPAAQTPTLEEARS